MAKKSKSADAKGSTGLKSKELNTKPKKDQKSVEVPEELSGSESESSDEDEDEDGNLITSNIDKGIESVLSALRSNSETLKDKNFRFFPEVGAEGTAESQIPEKREKPVYLKDYQREQLLSRGKDPNGRGDEQDDFNNVDGLSYAETQRQLKDEFKQQLGDEDEEDDLLTKRSGPSREIPDVALPDPDKDADGFLDAFINSKGWLPSAKETKKEVPTYGQVVSNGCGEDDNEDSDSFDDLSEKFESAYNFRFEDPEAAEIVSYARDQSTLRRGKLSGRQKKREKEKEDKEKAAEQQKLDKARLKRTKVNEVTNKLAQLQEALGQGDERLAEMLSKEDLDGDWDNDDWDRRMQKLFDEEFYGNKDSDMAAGLDSKDSNEYPDFTGEEDLGAEISAGPSDYDQQQYEEAPSEKRMTRKELKRKAEEFVDNNQDLLDEAMLPQQPTFRYRQVDPESFGLTSRDILLASDQELNQFVGMKKLASYRDKARMEADSKRFSKSKRLRQWRKDVFGDESAPTNDAWEKALSAAAAEVQDPSSSKKRKVKSDKKDKSKHKDKNHKRRKH